jgi:16S rRNA C1402 N4-methylase RsmH
VRAAMVELEKGWYVMTTGETLAHIVIEEGEANAARLIDAAIAEAVKAEREACATSALQHHIDIYAPDAEARSEQARIIAAAIRARGGA